MRLISAIQAALDGLVIIRDLLERIPTQQDKDDLSRDFDQRPRVGEVHPPIGRAPQKSSFTDLLQQCPNSYGRAAPA